MVNTVLLFGPSGLVGNCLFNVLRKDESIKLIKLFTRRKYGSHHLKITEAVIDFENLDSSSTLITGDAIFCCIGTTIKKAGTQEAFRKTDFDLPVKLAAIAAKNKVKCFVVISSLGANANSTNFYLRTKGEMENEVLKSGVEHVYIIRPSLLLGNRKEFRLGEIIGKGVIRLISPMMIGKWKKYKGIEAETVANAMLNIAKAKPQQKIFESDKIIEWGYDL